MSVAQTRTMGTEKATKNERKLGPYSQTMHACIVDLFSNPGMEGVFSQTRI